MSQSAAAAIVAELEAFGIPADALRARGQWIVRFILAGRARTIFTAYQWTLTRPDIVAAIVRARATTVTE